MFEDVFEPIFCRRVQNVCDGYEQTDYQQQQQITTLSVEVTNLQREKNELITGATLSKQDALKQIDALNGKISGYQTQISQLQTELNQSIVSNPAFSPTFGNLPESTRTLLLAYMNKYPEAFVTYGGRYWGAKKNKYNLDVKAWLLQGQNDWEIVSKVKAAKARVSDVLLESPDLPYHEACDRAFMRVTNALGDSINYTFDSSTWGADCAEFWQFASETRTIGGGDCEDKAIYNFVGARIAGIPWEMLRITAGMTYSNEGHCTNFYYASDLKFHHRNSTTNYPASKSVTSLPLTGDDSENLNIKTPWFSATENKTFNWFGTEAAKKDAAGLKDDPFFKWLKIMKI